MSLPRARQGQWKYDVALSFAGEDRAYVEAVARALRDAGVRVFYDRYEEAQLWGKDLYEHLRQVYSEQAEFTIIFVSAAYASRLWTKHELRSAQERALREAREYILPARLDGTPLPGVFGTVAYVELRGKSPAQLAELALQKLSKHTAPENRAPHYIAGDLSTEVDRTLICIRKDTWISVDPAAYRSVAALLDDLFLNYLYQEVRPYSYGGSWVLRQKDHTSRLLVPLEWLSDPYSHVVDIAPDWTETASPRQCGVVTNTKWYVEPCDRDKPLRRVQDGGPPSRYFGVAANSTEVVELVVDNPKLFWLMLSARRDFAAHDPAEVDARAFSDVGVFAWDMFSLWMDAEDQAITGKVLVHNGTSIPDFMTFRSSV